MAQKFYSWRDELREVADIPSSEPETEDKSEKKIKETNVKNKIKINPTMGEAFEEIGGTLLEVVELDEDSRRRSNKQDAKRVKLNIKHHGSNYTPPRNYDPDANRGQGAVLTHKQMEKKRRKALRQDVSEKMDMKKADMGDVVKDFYKSDAPQFKGKSKEKRREMAIAAKLQAEKPQ